MYLRHFRYACEFSHFGTPSTGQSFVLPVVTHSLTSSTPGHLSAILTSNLRICNFLHLEGTSNKYEDLYKCDQFLFWTFLALFGIHRRDIQPSSNTSYHWTATTIKPWLEEYFKFSYQSSQKFSDKLMIRSVQIFIMTFCSFTHTYTYTYTRTQSHWPAIV